MGGGYTFFNVVGMGAVFVAYKLRYLWAALAVLGVLYFGYWLGQ